LPAHIDDAFMQLLEPELGCSCGCFPALLVFAAVVFNGLNYA
jgi:hypothetical protein